MYVKDNSDLLDLVCTISWPFYRDNRGKLRYRLKYLIVEGKPATLFLKRIIDNKEQNLDLYPAHRLETYSADDE